MSDQSSSRCGDRGLQIFAMAGVEFLASSEWLPIYRAWLLDLHESL
jgi:hypothetical protein